MNILITGGASGLGSSITKELAKDSSNFVYFTYYNSKEEAQRIEEEFNNVKSIRCNFTDQNEINALITQLGQMNLQVLINNAFSTKISSKHFHKTDTQDFINGFNYNILPTIQIAQPTIALFRKQKFGKIITVLTSYLVNKPPIGLSEYVAYKAYLESLSKSWANENANFNITSNCISPSFMQTTLTEDTDERVIEEMISSHPLKKLLTPKEVAESIAFLTKCSQQINGINLVLNSAKDLI
jgi:NAD(P)-dependent dehydrogenase (short-subunit alcohol dehydrogenase family)